MKTVHVEPTRRHKPKRVYFFIAVIAVSLLVGYLLGQSDQRKEDDLKAAEVLMSIREDLLLANDIPKPVHIEVLGLEIAGWEKGYAADVWRRDALLAGIGE